MTQWLKSNRGLGVFILCFGFFRAAIADWNPIPSGSMRPTLLEGDVVLVETAWPTTIAPVSRRIGYGMGVVAVRATERVGGSRRTAQFLPYGGAKRTFGPVVVPADHYFMLCDNRDNSEDSRFIGFVPRELVIGHAHTNPGIRKHHRKLAAANRENGQPDPIAVGPDSSPRLDCVAPEHACTSSGPVA